MCGDISQTLTFWTLPAKKKKENAFPDIFYFPS